MATAWADWWQSMAAASADRRGRRQSRTSASADRRQSMAAASDWRHSRAAAIEDGGVSGATVEDGGVGGSMASWLTWKGAAWADQRRRDSRGRELSGSGEEREGGGRWISRWDVGAILSVGISPR
uniref:Uncharacterized protein n=1 Tax=Oryza sativa subsp. japonica TaxID=39947 RepID=Q2QT74_ORYSJ|nr:hypothetical protein LOC_Os12g21610 [Oryza sativa Japonica Group]